MFTDNNPLAHIKRTKRLSALEQRWINSLNQFDFDIKFRPGRSNAAADALSRLPALTKGEVSDSLEKTNESSCLPTKLRKFVAEIALQEIHDNQSELTAPGEPSAVEGTNALPSLSP